MAPTPTSSRDTQAANRGTPRRAPTPEESAQYKRDEAVARSKNAQRRANTKRNAANFDDAFRDARRAGVATFTWDGKQYSTKMK
jgi:LAS superfamily LD-carboxypeptidase LdcB